MSDNWYIVLELEFDPPVEDESIIAQKIDEKSKFWSTHFNDFKNGAQYRKWHQSIPQIKKDMIGENNIRKQLSTEACSIVYGPIDKLLKTIGRKGNITADEGDKISKKLKVEVSVIKKRVTKLGIKWIEGTVTDYQAVYYKYYKTKPQNALTFDGMKQMLKTFNVDNLYDFLYAGTSVKNANRLPCETLRQRAKEKKHIEFCKNNTTSNIGTKLCSSCERIFIDDSSKNIYDKYLEYTKRIEILEYAKTIADISGKLSGEQACEFIGQLTCLFRDRKIAEEVFFAFCQIEKITFENLIKNEVITRCVSILNETKEIADICGGISKEQTYEIVDRLIHILRDEYL